MGTAGTIEGRGRGGLRFTAAQVVLLSILLALTLPDLAKAAEAPKVADVWASEVTATSSRLRAELIPGGASTSYHFDFLAATEYEANLAQGAEGFAGAQRAPAGADAPVGSGTTTVSVSQALAGLTPGRAYRYRIVAKNSAGPTVGMALVFVTQELAAKLLPDDRGWEMVSPLNKNGGEVAAPESLAGGGVLQAAAQGGLVTYSSAASFGPDAQGAPNASQYLGSRAANSWLTTNLTTPALSGSYGAGAVGAPYQLFSLDLGRALLLNGRHCRDGGEGCPVANTPLPRSGAPAGYQNYYLRESSQPGFRALLTAADLVHTSVAPEWFDLVLAGATPDLGSIALSTCAALTADATEVVAGGACDSEAPNLYLWRDGELRLVNVLPGAQGGAPGGSLAAQAGAIAEEGSRVYWRWSGDLYLREGLQTKPVDAAAGGGTFEAASANGEVAFFRKGGHLYRYEAVSEEVTDLTPAGGVEGVLGASRDGEYLYYRSDEGLFLRHGASTVAVAADADAANYLAGAARVTADGKRLAFVATEPLTGYDNVDQLTGERDSQVYLYDATDDSLVCVSCNATLGRPQGPSSLPGVRANGGLPGSLRVYKPRSLSSDGRRVFFDSEDALVPGDSNGSLDAYQWEAAGVGDCSRSGGCVSLISSGRAGGGSFADASASGDDAYFLTTASLVSSDPGSTDLYDARVDGGFPIPPNPIPCDGDACQPLPSPPPDQVVGTLVPGLGNPPVRYQKAGRGKKHKKRHHRHRRHHPKANRR